MEVIRQIWRIIWDNSVFHWAIAVVLAIAVIFEFATVWNYCRKSKAAIEYLSNQKKQKKGKNVSLSKLAASGLNEDFGIDNPNSIRRPDGKFVITKYPSILARPIPRSSLRFVTTLCTAIGVLGTFYGIQAGLQGIDLDATNSQQIMASIQKLLVGMRTAFSTSLMGLGAGSLFTLILFASDSLRQKRRDSLRQKLKAIAILETADNANQKAAESLSLVADKLTGLNQLSAESIGEAVGRSISSQFAGLNQLSSQSIGEAVGQQMQRVTIPYLRYLQGIYQEQQKLRELQENQGQRVLEKLIQDLRVEVIEPIADRLDESAALTKEASEAVQTLHRELGGISQSLANSILTIQNFQQETLQELQGFANHLGQTLTQFQTDTRGVLQQTADEINRAVDQSIEGMTTQRTAFESSAEQAAATFQGIREELERALHERAEIEQQMLEATQTGIMRILTQANTAFQQQSNTLESVGNNASELINSAKNNLQATLGNIDSTLTATSQSLQADLTQFRQESQANLQAFFQQTSAEMNSAIEGSIQGMAAQRTAFEASAEQASATFQGIREELERALHERAEIEQQMLEGTRTGIMRILTQAHRAFQQQSQTLETVGNNASELMNSAKNNLLATLENIDATLTATRQTVQDDLTKFREEYQSNLQAFFQEQNDLLEGTLGEQRDGLNQVVQNLDKVFQEEATRRSQLTQEIDTTMDKIKDSVKQIKDLAITAGLHDSSRLIELNALAENIGQQVALVDNSYKNLDEKFANSLNIWQSHLENYINRTITSQTQYFENADQAMSQVCGNLLETARVLVAAQDDGNLSNGRNGHG
jgi:hypothetical protein